jgi:DNA-binding HxlR family transcriptional regulator
MDYKELASNPVSVLLQLVGAKWKLLIVKELLNKEQRFVELKKKLGCTAKVLTACLKEMEEDGLIVREAYEGKPPRVEYYLTEIGYTLRPVLDSMQKWGKEYKRLRKLMEKYKDETNLSGA